MQKPHTGYEECRNGVTGDWCIPQCDGGYVPDPARPRFALNCSAQSGDTARPVFTPVSWCLAPCPLSSVRGDPSGAMVQCRDHDHKLVLPKQVVTKPVFGVVTLSRCHAVICPVGAATLSGGQLALSRWICPVGAAMLSRSQTTWQHDSTKH